jgi:hypothetical protein
MATPVITLTPRPIFKEDCSLTISPVPVTTSANVLTASGSVPATVHAMDIVFYSSLVVAANDAAAAAAGVAVGQLYVTGSSVLQTRMT